ncbi:MAG TPA: PAS domain-containing protein [Geminicoccaceae bacterium]|nr:PAS domain-containing protein [Geminicoccaceae bacterium]
MFTFVPCADGGGAFPDASPTMVEICGIAPDEVRRDVSPLFRRIEPDDLAQLRRAIAQGTREEAPWDVEFRYRHPSKGLVWMRVRCTPLTGADGSLQWHGFINDITQRKEDQRELEKRNEQLRLALLSSRTGIWSWDLATDAITWSDEVYRIFGTRSFDGTPEHFRRFVHPDDDQRLWAALTAAIAGHKPYEIDARIVRPDGQVRWLSNHGMAAYDQAGRPLSMTSTVRDITGRKEADEQLRKFAFLVNNSRDLIAMCDLDGRLLFVNEAGLALIGLDSAAEARATSIGELFFPEDRARVTDAFLPGVLRGGHGTIEIRFRHFETGEPVWMSFSVFMLQDEDGRPLGFATISQDIGARKRDEERMEFLIDELNHRVRNTLAIVNAIATQTLKHAPSVQEFRIAFGGRIAALAKIHTLFASTKWSAATLRDLIVQQLEPYARDRADALVISGPRLLVNPKPALTLSLVIHELTTNAAKYGALSAPAGRIAIQWRIGPDRRLLLGWKESGGPQVARPTVRGFGTQLIEFNIAHEFGGEARLDFLPTGLEGTLTIPLRGPRDEI